MGKKKRENNEKYWRTKKYTNSAIWTLHEHHRSQYGASFLFVFLKSKKKKKKETLYTDLSGKGVIVLFSLSHYSPPR